VSYFGDSTNTDPFASNGGASFNSFLPPQPPKKSNKGLVVALVSFAGVLLLAGLGAGALFVISKVTTSQPSSSSAGEKANPNQGDNSGEVSASGDPALDALNAAGSIAWSQDAFAYMGSYPPLATYLSDQGSDGSSCALWLYNNKSEALAAEQGGDFDQMESGTTWGDSNDGSLGYVLVSDSQTTECAVQAFAYLGF
jgi:flagellar basal body-associated protein FliL